jgi:hypothetical protein
MTTDAPMGILCALPQELELLLGPGCVRQSCVSAG